MVRAMTHDPDQHSSLKGMYSDYFLDYASYVILERAVPHLNDGLKPVQRRILHSMDELDDGRYNKVANVVGNTMKYHPHGDQSIADAMVGLGQKELLIDTQGNWGNALTGDGAAASRYIEARLTKFALERELVSGRIDAVIDTSEPEVLPADSRLYALPNVFLTPHIAGAQGRETWRLVDLALDEIERFAAGAPLLHEVRREDWERIA